MMVDRLLKGTPDGQLTMFKSRQFGKKCLAQWAEGFDATSLRVSGGVRRSTVLLQRPFVTATSHLDVGYLVGW